MIMNRKIHGIREREKSESERVRERGIVQWKRRRKR